MTYMSRREFAARAASAAAAPFALDWAPANASALTAADLLDRIKRQIGVEWKSETVDGVKAGDPSTAVTGIATTSLATLDVLRQAVKASANVVITSQPTFYSRSDSRRPPAGRGAPAEPPPPDPVFDAKNAIVDEHRLVIIRLSDHWRLRQPDPHAQGLALAMRWTKQSRSDPRRFEVPAAPLRSLVTSLKTSLGARGGIRVIGDPQLDVQRVGFLPGSTPIQASLRLLPEVDAVVAGEVREWESVEYARDKVFAGEKKALILLGRIVSEEPGMSVCADWLKTVAPEVSVRHLSAGDPYWRPRA
jgi:putative NIF3 family GTP cyclohydrolase 1 type 2